MVKHFEVYVLFLLERINDLRDCGWNLLKFFSAATLRRKVQVAQNGVSVYFCKYVELNDCVRNKLNRRNQLKVLTSLHASFQNTHCRMQDKAPLKILQKLIQSCVETNDRPEKNQNSL